MINETDIEKASKLAYLPIVFHFLIIPHVPEGASNIFGKSGEPVFTEFTKVNWPALSRSVRRHLDDYVPKSIGVYVANDGPDIMDIQSMNILTRKQETNGPNFLDRALREVNRLKIKDLRGGISKLDKSDSIMHINPTLGNGRPPISGIIIGFKFKDMSQATDHISLLTSQLFGHDYSYESMGNPVLKETKGLQNPGEMTACIHEWLAKEFGVVYSPKCTVITLGNTFSDDL